MPTKIMPISDLRRQTSQIIQTIREGGDAIYITQHGRPAAVLVEYEAYENLLARLEDLSDMVSLEAAKDETDRDYEAFLAEMNTDKAENG
ncbi:MAG: type II toxin-antitoxin system Phd/YefM family antitoxin [Anaerolineae bacterium]|jgi:prevent-host-death family protein|nr:type II toxin-antitoxin system Phd/YefM family antitoxin [Anaerolineae bacterium]